MSDWTELIVENGEIKEIKSEPYFTSFKQTNKKSKWIKDRSKKKNQTIEILEEYP